MGGMGCNQWKGHRQTNGNSGLRQEGTGIPWIMRVLWDLLRSERRPAQLGSTKGLLNGNGEYSSGIQARSIPNVRSAFKEVAKCKNTHLLKCRHEFSRKTHIVSDHGEIMNTGFQA